MKGSEMYLKSYKLGLQNSLEYRFDFLLSIVSTIVPTVTQLFLWTAMFESSETGIIYGYTYSSMIMYTILAGVVSKLMAAGCEWTVATISVMADSINILSSQSVISDTRFVVSWGRRRYSL